MILIGLIISFKRNVYYIIYAFDYIYLSKFTSKMVHPIANVRVINRCNEMRTNCSHFGC